jgi:hypothetical protein
VKYSVVVPAYTVRFYGISRGEEHEEVERPNSFFVAFVRSVVNKTKRARKREAGLRVVAAANGA